ncbi:MAG TPA: VWA domain-containing protein [Candidatus Limnocylindrales bacterium]|nr:VWA domain-containing protein [Candidatus Limnocylindrales bacterium]
MRLRYTIWDGTQRVRLDPDAVFDRLAEHLGYSDDLAEAFDRLLREGMAGEEFEVAGIDELAAKVREAIEEFHNKYNLERSLAQPWNDLDEITGMEQEATERMPPGEKKRRRQQDLEGLSRILEEALMQMSRWPFDDRDARAAFEDLSERGDDIRRVERFQRRYRDQFHGPDSLDFEQTLEMLEFYERLRELERALLERDFDSIDPDAVREMLGQEIAEQILRLQQLARALTDAGYVVTKGGRYVLSPKGARRLGQIALREILHDLLADASGRHDTRKRGASEMHTEDAKPYEFGDPFVLDVAATVRAALSRGTGTPVAVQAADVHVKESHRLTRTATVLLLDMSWSMSWEGRFAAAKKVALAMETLMRTRFPRDYFGLVGFYTRAVELRPADLAEVTWNMGDPFTNLQDGLRLGADLLSRHPAATQQMIVITDGQPTAYFHEGRLFCEWPMSIGGLSTRATVETLKEVERVTRRGVRINTFMLDDSPPLRSFVQRMTAINKGRAFYTTPDQLGRFVLVDHVAKRKKVV